MPYGSDFFFRPLRMMSQDPVSTSREPAPANYRRIRIGDVGFIQRGKFYLLFSAGRPLGKRQPGKDVPITFKELTVGRTTFSQPRPAGCIQTFREFGVSPGVRSSISPCVLSTRRFFAYLKSTPSRSPKPGAHPLLKLTGDHGAALITRYPTYREDCRHRRSKNMLYATMNLGSRLPFKRDARKTSDPFLCPVSTRLGTSPWWRIRTRAVTLNLTQLLLF